MSLTSQLEKEIALAGTSATNLAIQQQGDTLICALAAIDSLGVSIHRLELQSTKLTGRSPERLREVADNLARRVSYLLEAIAPIEIDDQACTIQMRSTPPYRKENATSYYEVLVTAGGISLRRFSKSRGTARQPEPFDLTRQVLYRLVDDFVAAAESA
ncbi:hypothetical protein [Aeoliella mucimassa]|uniref:Uncharacterized protein n=1 Tax=Aeoliella mucimassa TaxID=2527972 RepID=A0A518AHN8_9BACT|nr:hypothetical protein [Aeoliella mucimassa]QDU54194.1 hypothetical protein Pan181_03740 [Aeoliella mucimassa]